MAGDLGEFMLGKIVVTPVLFESLGQFGDPSTEDWTDALIAETKAKIEEAMRRHELLREIEKRGQ